MLAQAWPASKVKHFIGRIEFLNPELGASDANPAADRLPAAARQFEGQRGLPSSGLKLDEPVPPSLHQYSKVHTKTSEKIAALDAVADEVIAWAGGAPKLMREGGRLTPPISRRAQAGEILFDRGDDLRSA